MEVEYEDKIPKAERVIPRKEVQCQEAWSLDDKNLAKEEMPLKSRATG